MTHPGSTAVLIVDLLPASSLYRHASYKGWERIHDTYAQSLMSLGTYAQAAVHATRHVSDLPSAVGQAWGQACG